MQRNEIQNFTPEHLEEAKGFAKFYDGFTDGCRVLFLIQRHKDGGKTNNSKLRAYITRNTQEWIECLAKLIEEKAKYPDIALRIYQTLNARNIEKGIKEFKQAMLNADYYDTESKHGFYLDVKNRIVSGLMTPSARATSYFLYDIDVEDPDTLKIISEGLKQHTEIIASYKTKKGFHVVVKPFNHTLFKCPQDVELKVDAMMLIKY